MTPYTSGIDEVRLDHVEFYVSDAPARAAELVTDYGFQICGAAGGPDPDAGRHSIVLRQGSAVVVLTQGTTDVHPASVYVARHGDGVAGITLRTADVRSVFDRAVANGARPLREPTRAPDDSGAVSAMIGGFGDVVHRLVQLAPGHGHGFYLEGFVPVAGAPTLVGAAERGIIDGIDHFAVCVEAGDLEPTVGYYRDTLGFREVYEERICVGDQVMISKVVQNASRDVTFTVIEPDPSAQPGQIDTFLKDHGGAGVQHVAFATSDIVHAVGDLTGRGIVFLKTPGAYYDMLGDRLSPEAHSVEQLRPLGILADEDHGGQLFQIFAKSVHPRSTFFFEVIERVGAKSFGSRNIKALYEAVERDQDTSTEAAGQL